MSTSHDHPRHLEFEPNHAGSQNKGNSGSSYYESHNAIHTPGQHNNDTERQGIGASASQWMARGNNKTWVGAGLAVLAAGAFVGLTRNKWSSWGSSLSDVAKKSGLTGGLASAGKQSGSQSRGSASSQSGSQNSSSGSKSSSASKQSDASLKQDVASSIKSSPSSSKSFTDEGATGNND
jgi:hypothetical protein